MIEATTTLTRADVQRHAVKMNAGATGHSCMKPQIKSTAPLSLSNPDRNEI